MKPEHIPLFCLFGLGVVLTMIVGMYCLLTTRNLVRALIGLEILTKGVTLLIILTGYVSGQVGLAQSLAITLIVIEVAVIVVAVSIVLGIYRRTEGIDSRSIREIKG
jgi:multisubunit Na+/H+ antiporter MnhC subunit